MTDYSSSVIAVAEAIHGAATGTCPSVSSDGHAADVAWLTTRIGPGWHPSVHGRETYDNAVRALAYAALAEPTGTAAVRVAMSARMGAAVLGEVHRLARGSQRGLVAEVVGGPEWAVGASALLVHLVKIAEDAS